MPAWTPTRYASRAGPTTARRRNAAANTATGGGGWERRRMGRGMRSRTASTATTTRGTKTATSAISSRRTRTWRKRTPPTCRSPTRRARSCSSSMMTSGTGAASLATWRSRRKKRSRRTNMRKEKRRPWAPAWAPPAPMAGTTRAPPAAPMLGTAPARVTPTHTARSWATPLPGSPRSLRSGAPWSSPGGVPGRVAHSMETSTWLRLDERCVLTYIIA
mmetsp:Transcript_18019/g.41398  ORF Transcript_18019/g.41398 Transcript_18019/m.41398 type:complete len:218 (+) Transcript_18019:835-1488(+)